MENEALQSSSHGLKNTAIWRLLDGPGATPEVAARTPVANRTAAGRLDFVLQVEISTPEEVRLHVTWVHCVQADSGLSVLSVYNFVA